MSKHTPGPWTAIDTIVVVTMQTHHYATWLANCSVGGEAKEQKLANASLIAAAPELLESLQDAISMIGPQLAKDTFGYEWFEKTSSAIAKATGETP